MKTTSFFIILFLLSQSIYTQNKKIEITYKRNKDNSISFFYKKNIHGSCYLTLEFDKLKNCNNSRRYNKVVKYKTGPLFTLRPANKKQGISFSYKVKYIIGNPNPDINNDVTYVLPFKTGKYIKVIEASNLGEKYFGSEKPIDWKSFVVYSNQSDTIYAMRKGIVIKITNKYKNDDTFKKSFTSKRNSIIIEHEDGTYTTYKGFDKNQMFVKLGQKVYPHTTLGKLDKFNETNYRLDFNIFHYLKNILNDDKSTLTNRIYKTKYLNPNFFLDNSNNKIKSNERYKVLFNEELKIQEFSRKEKKKYTKNPSDYQ